MADGNNLCTGYDFVIDETAGTLIIRSVTGSKRNMGMKKLLLSGSEGDIFTSFKPAC